MHTITTKASEVNNPGPQTQHPSPDRVSSSRDSGVTVHLSADDLSYINKAIDTLDDFDGTFKFFAEDAVCTLIGAIQRAEATWSEPDEEQHPTISGRFSSATYVDNYDQRTTVATTPSRFHGTAAHYLSPNIGNV